ncbi:MAG: hypothetical protein M3167_16320, partial [Acidobacteriota bacterium]|nr:hypothetical protein [Acidobacteriota bacterium]
MTKSMPPAGRISFRGSGPGRLGLLVAGAALLAALFPVACGKEETAGAGGTAATGSTGASPAAEPTAPAQAPGPSIRETAEAGRPAWDGLK